MKIRHFLTFGLITSLCACSPTSSFLEKDLRTAANLPAIIGGQIVESEIFARHVVAIRNLDSGAWCTGTLITKDIVLTAAHCINVGSVKSFVVYFSKSPKSSPDSWRRISHLKFDLRYNPKAFENRYDLGVLRIHGPLPSGYAPMALASAHDLANMGQDFYAAGYGMVSGRKEARKESGILRYTIQSLMKAPLRPEDSQFTVNQRNGRGICFGDSGGPAFIKLAGRRILIGIASAVYSLDQREKKQPHYDACRSTAIYIAAYYHLPWIRQAIAEVSY